MMPSVMHKDQVFLIILILSLLFVIPVYAAPVANFSGDPLSGRVPLPVTFTDLSAGSPPVGWTWFFGDENFSGKWTLVNHSAGWSSRFFPSCVAFPDGSMVLTGGMSLNGYLNDVWQSTDKGDTWTRMNPSAGWAGRRSHTSVAMPDGSIVLMGGQVPKGLLNDVWQSPDKGATWTLLKPNDSNGWSPRSYASSVVLADGTIVLMGGMASAGVVMNDVWQSSDNGTTWNCVNSSAGWRGRYGHRSLLLPDGSILVMGGKYHVYETPLNDVWRSTDHGATWTEIKPDNSNGWAPRVNANSVVLPDGSVLVMGGSISDDAAKNDIWRSTDNGATWVCTDTSAEWSPRYGSGCVILPDSSIIVMGGITSNGLENDVWSILPAGSSTQNPSHVYTTAGVYDVTLLVYDSTSSSSMRKAAYLDVAPPAPRITSLSPSTKPLGGAPFNLVVNGNYFSGASVVQWDGVNKTTTFNTPEKLTAAIPAGDYATMGPRAVTVMDPAGGTSNTVLFMVTDPLGPQVTSVTPKTGFRNSTVAFTLAGKNFLSGAVVNFTNAAYSDPYGSRNITADITIPKTTQIKGNVTFPVSAPLGTWNITVTDPLHGTSNIIPFSVIIPPIPKITSFNPTSGPRNTTVSFTLSGSNFVQGVTVNFTNSMFTHTDGTSNLTATVLSTVPTKITGTVYLPLAIPNGKWDITVTNPDNEPVRKNGTFLVKDPEAAVVKSVVPTSGARNTTVSFTLSGSKFAAGATVNFSNSTYTHTDGTSNLTATVLFTTPTKITGTVSLPLAIPTGKWDISVTNPDAVPGWKNKTFLVKDPESAVVRSVNPTSGTRGTTVSFTLTGSKFSPGIVVNFTNRTYVAGDGGSNLTTTVASQTVTQVKGSLTIPGDALVGKWDVVATNPDAPEARKNGTFTVK